MSELQVNDYFKNFSSDQEDWLKANPRFYQNLLITIMFIEIKLLVVKTFDDQTEKQDRVFLLGSSNAVYYGQVYSRFQ